jgi:hypothetical protein
MTISRFTNLNIGLLPGKILQVVRATDSTNRTLAATNYTDLSISVTITPQKSDSAILVVALGQFVISRSSGNTFARLRITDSSNNAISGAQQPSFGGQAITDFYTAYSILAYATPATTSAVTYKLQGICESITTLTLENANNTGQMYAIEVSA